MKKIIVILILSVMYFFVSHPVYSASPTSFISPIDQGWYSNDGQHIAGLENYVVETDPSNDWHNFFVFDIADVDYPIEGATLQLYTWIVAGGRGNFNGEVFHAIFGASYAHQANGLILYPALVPEPISSILFVTGGILLAGRRYIKRKKKA